MDPNIYAESWDRETPGARRARVGAAAGTRDLGATVVELDAGAQAAPFHFHHAQEELLVVLSGTPQLRTPDGVRQLEPGAVVAFPAGPGGAHRLRNTGTETCRYLIVSTGDYPEVVEYPDTGATLVAASPTVVRAFPHGTSVEFPEIISAALAADAAG